jgi:hypothetical protein
MAVLGLGVSLAAAKSARIITVAAEAGYPADLAENARAGLFPGAREAVFRNIHLLAGKAADCALP